MMKLISVCGPPSSGKTAMILRTVENWTSQSLRIGVAKFDCLFTEDDVIYSKAGLHVRKALSGPLCPDHYFISNIQEIFDWATSEKLDILITESAGLCNRCSPFLRGATAVCVIDNLSGIGTPRKVGPMLRTADIVVITKGDIVSQAEREVFSASVLAVNASANIFQINGLTGQGTHELSRFLLSRVRHLETLDGQSLRFPMPAAVCSYCLGETRVGTDYQIGNLRKLRPQQINSNDFNSEENGL
jgi:Ni2+-binding GTPase involved in maturation of urease and hydrogenase